MACRRASAFDVPDTTFSLTIWNIGYAGLGAKADFFVDGGAALRALSAAEISDAADEIASQLAALPSDVLMLQENAGAGFLTRGVPVRQRVEAALAGHRSLGIEVYSRVDVLLDAAGNPFVLEANTIPGMTETSLLPKSAAAGGIPFPELCLKIAERSLELGKR